jgi:hypothetical protein
VINMRHFYYAEATKRSSMDGGEDALRSFILYPASALWLVLSNPQHLLPANVIAWLSLPTFRGKERLVDGLRLKGSTLEAEA